MIHAISLGAGVQSSTLALMFACGELTPMPDCAIFADTGAEPRAVYEWLAWLEQRLPFPVHRVIYREGLRENIIAATAGGRFAGAPFFTKPGSHVGKAPCECTWVMDGIYLDADEEEREGFRSGDPRPDCMACGGTGLVEVLQEREGQLRRQCTREFKVQPIRTKLRQMLGLQHGQRAPREILVVQYIGISFDEVQRMKPSREHWVEHQWPLVDLRMTRKTCLAWMEAHGFPRPPRSACTFCPYHSNEEWRHLKNEHPADFASAVEIDRMIRAGVRGTHDPLFVHRSLVPLELIDFNSEPEKSPQIDAFGAECEGMCGN